MALRTAAGLSSKGRTGAEIGLCHSLFAMILRNSDNHLIGMGRVVGDGGCFYQVADIAVDPAYQGRGLGKLVMSEIMKYQDAHALKDSYVSLIADAPADELYKKYGFDYITPRSVGMYKRY